MNIEKRDNSLDEIFGIIDDIVKVDDVVKIEDVEEIQPETQLEIKNPNTSIEIPHDESFNEFNKQKIKLNELYDKSIEVLESAKDQAISFSTSRDVEVYAKLLDSMVNVQEKLATINEKIYQKDKKINNDVPKQTQNNIFVGNIRELNDLIKKGQS